MSANTPWAESAIKLLKGPIYKSKDKRQIWNSIIEDEENLNDYFSAIGLRVHLDKTDGYAYLEQIDDAILEGMEEESDEDEIQSLPRLIRRQTLSYNQSMLLVLIRRELSKFESSSAESEALILKKSDIADFYKSFSKDYADQARTDRALDSMIKSFVKLTFLFDDKGYSKDSYIPDDAEFEVSPIIKAKIDITFMKEFLEKMQNEVNK